MHIFMSSQTEANTGRVVREGIRSQALTVVKLGHSFCILPIKKIALVMTSRQHKILIASIAYGDLSSYK